MDIHILVSVLLVICQGPFQTVSAGGALPLPAALGTALGTAARTAADRASGAPWRSRRSKRCSCSSLMDKECVYFCHLDIIWVNTPEQTVPYGLGNTRTRRALQDKRHFGLKKRCQCTSEKDKKCFTFCQMEAELRAQSALQKGGNPVDKDEECLVPGLKCVHSRNMKRFETIDNAIKTSFRIAKIKASLKEMKTMKHNRTNKKQSIWERLKTTP